MKLRTLAFVMLLLMSLTLPVHAAGVVGDGTPASCTFKALKQAVKLGGEITFNCGTQPVVISFPKTLKLKTDVTLDGGGLVRFDGGKAVRLIRVDSYVNLTVRGLTFQQGMAVTDGDDDGGEGAAINGLWRSNLTIEDSRFIKNKSYAESFDYGGAVRLHEGTLIIRGSEFFKNKVKGGSGGAVFGMLSNVDISDTIFTKNKSDGYGGAFYNDGTLMHTENGYIRFTRVDFIGNKGRGQGGAVFNFLYGNPSGELYQPGASLTVTDTSFVDNIIEPSDESPALGGGLRIGNGPATLTNVLFANNHAAHQGGAIWTGEVTGGRFTNVTMTGNTAEYGGALTVASSGKIEIVNATIVYNQAVQGGGVWSGEDSNVKLWNTILAHNTATNPWDLKHNCGYPLKDGGGVIEFPQADGSSGDPHCVAGAAFVDPLLLSLADNGGRFATHALGAGSPAINTGQNAACPAVDARGLPRDGQCDIGAYELQSSSLLPLALPID
jgi:predicted outer membrane repeat protein